MISFIVASIGRPSLAQTLASIVLLPGDELIVVGAMGEVVDPRVRFIPTTPGGDWGHAERNFAMPFARGQYLAHIDDDDVYAPGARQHMETAIHAAPGRPAIFRMQYPNGLQLWREQQFYCGNIGTPMMVFPNRPTMLGHWAPYVGGDFNFLQTSRWKPEEFVWNEHVVALLGHN